MGIPYSYSIRNLLTRNSPRSSLPWVWPWWSFVFAATLMLSEGLRKTLVDTGSYDNAVVIRKAANSEVQSGVERLKASIIEPSLKLP